jgi:SRSO17 transposase
MGIIGKSLKDPHAMAYCFAFCRKGTSLAELAGAAGARWALEGCFVRAKDDLGLDPYDARSWQGWHRHMTLVMIAAAFLVKLSADQRRHAFTKHP